MGSVLDSALPQTHSPFFFPINRKVDIQWKLFSLIHDIGKVLHYGLR